MPKKLPLIISLISGLLLVTTPLATAGERAYPLLDLRLGEWFSRADASWQISFPYAGYTGESELEFEDIDSDLFLLEARLRPIAKFSLSLNLGMGNIDNGVSTDTDRLAGWTFSESI